MSDLIKNVEHAKPFSVLDAVDYEEGATNSLTLAQQKGCKMTLFTIDKGEGMSSHAAPGDAMAFVLEGEATITIEGTPHDVKAGNAIVMPAGAKHSVLAKTPFKMLLTVVIGEQ